MSTKAIHDALYFAKTVASDTTRAHEAYARAGQELAAIEQEVTLLRAQVEALGLEIQKARNEALEEAAKAVDKERQSARWDDWVEDLYRDLEERIRDLMS